MKSFALFLIGLIIISGCVSIHESTCNPNTIITNEGDRIRCFEKEPDMSARCLTWNDDVNCEPILKETSCSLACIQSYRGDLS